MSEAEHKPARTRTTTREPEVSESLIERVVEATLRTEAQRAARPSPMNLRTFEEIEAFAERVCRSKLCPKDYVGKPDDAIIAVMKGNELGLPPMAALESIAVVNGRASLWGEAVPGLCMQSGLVQDVVERFEGEEGSDDFAAVCIVTRRGMTPREGRFSYGDVRKAGLKNVHVQYPKDMIMWRARHRAWHGAFPDVLKGLATAEIEQEQSLLPAWPMPRPEKSWFESKPQDRGDGWTRVWLDKAIDRLAATGAGWEWLRTMTALLEEAPTARDVEELRALPGVPAMLKEAPDEAKTTLDHGVQAALQRLGKKPDATDTGQAAKPATQAPAAASDPEANPAAPPSSEATTGTHASGDEAAFGAWVLDDAGEAIEEYTDPVAYADHLRTLYHHTGNRLGLIEQNADGIEDAIASSPEAKAIIDEFTEPADDPTEGIPVNVIHVPVVRGQPDWKAYMTHLKATIADVSAEYYLDFLAANRGNLTDAPAHTKPLLVKLYVARAKELGIEPPAALAEAMKPPAGSLDKDDQAVDNMIDQLKDLRDANAVKRWGDQMTMKALIARFEREGKQDKIERMREAGKARLEELRAGA